MSWESWRVNGSWHRVDEPSHGTHGFYWHGKGVRREDLPWLRRGQHGLVVPLAAYTGQQSEPVPPPPRLEPGCACHERWVVQCCYAREEGNSVKKVRAFFVRAAHNPNSSLTHTHPHTGCEDGTNGVAGR